MKQKIKYLEKIRAKDSGLLDYNKEEHQKEVELESQRVRHYKDQSSLNNNDYYLYLNKFILGNFEELDEIFNQDPSVIASVEIRALDFLNSAILALSSAKEKLKLSFARDKNFNLKFKRNLAKNIAEMFFSLGKNIAEFQKPLQKINLWGYTQELTELSYYLLLSEIKATNLKAVDESKFQKAIQNYSKLITKEGLETEELNLYKADLLYLQSLYYQKTKDLNSFSSTMIEYYELKANESKGISLVGFSNQNTYKAEEILKNWSKILAELDEVQNKVERLAGIYSDTCSYFECSDCCTYANPIMSLTEYLYLKNWLEQNNYDLKAIKTKTKKIQEEHQEIFGTKLAVVEKGQKENPNDFAYTCPFLKDGSCSIYEARPVLCRSFGSGSNNLISIKACNFYANQHINNASPDNERYVYDLRSITHMTAISDQKLESKSLSGAIAAWFSQDQY